MSKLKTVLGVAASAAAISLGSLGVAQPASALPPPCYPNASTSALAMQRWCPPDPDPDPGPSYHDEYSKVIAEFQVDAYDAQHVKTTVQVKSRYDNATGQLLGTWVHSGYHVWNDWQFQGWHVTVRESLQGTDRALGLTDEHVIGVTPKFFDPAGADVYVSYDTPITPEVGNALYSAQQMDRFSN